MGLGLYFVEGEGPKFHKPLRTETDINDLNIIDTKRDLKYVTDAVSLIRRELNGRVPLIGFSGSPWTLATYMIEGQSSRDFPNIKMMLYKQPESLHQLLDKLALSVINYLNAQISSGAQAVQIFDTWGGVLSHDAYAEFSLAYMEKIVNGLVRHSEGRDVPVILFTKGGGQWLELLADTGCDGIGLDWTTDIGSARRRVGDSVALQGNMDPAVLRSDQSSIEYQVKSILQSYGTGAGHIFNLGHGITPDIDPNNVKAFVDAVHQYSQR
jgi:uroporphyrinogen decarboxylase